jgi:hypothetical protein
MELVISIGFPIVTHRSCNGVARQFSNLVHLEREECSTENKVRPTDRRRVFGLLSLPVTHRATSQSSSANMSNFGY